MDWQQPVALGIVAVTAIFLGWSQLRQRKTFEKSLPCGCGKGRTGLKPASILIQSRRGEPQKIIFRQD